MKRKNKQRKKFHFKTAFNFFKIEYKKSLMEPLN